MLDESLANSLSVVLGQMFFQAVDLTYQADNASKLQTLALSLNENALPGTYLGNQAVSQNSSSAFIIEPDYAPLKMNDQMNGLPTFSANLTGIPADVDPFYLIDFA